jgi:hypothetical protein
MRREQPLDCPVELPCHFPADPLAGKQISLPAESPKAIQRLDIQGFLVTKGQFLDGESSFFPAVREKGMMNGISRGSRSASTASEVCPYEPDLTSSRRRRMRSASNRGL